jgi:hypothetical protein
MPIYRIKPITHANFAHYIDTDNTSIEVRRYIGPFAPKEVQFQVTTPIHPLLRPHYNNATSLVHLINIEHQFCFVKGNYIVFVEQGYLWILHEPNITGVRMLANAQNNAFIPVNQIPYLSGCLIDVPNKKFMSMIDIEPIETNAPRVIVLESLQPLSL